MTEWTMVPWRGTPEAAEAALRALGWHGPEEAPSAAADPRVGGFLPAAGTPLQVFDGVAYLAVAASAPIETPPGLAPAGPQLFRALLGSF
jgi:hypothetical protein